MTSGEIPLWIRPEQLRKLRSVLAAPNETAQEYEPDQINGQPWIAPQYRTARVTGFNSGAFGVTDSGLTARLLRTNGTDAMTTDISLFVRSFGANVAEYGRIKLSLNTDGSGGTYPQLAVGSPVWFVRMPYAGQMRNVVIDHVVARGCP